MAKINWWSWFEIYEKELCEIARMHYEHYRNRQAAKLKKRFPSAIFPQYRVNEKRYGDAIWMELIENCFAYGVDAALGMSMVYNQNASRMPWPDRLWCSIEPLVDEIKRESMKLNRGIGGIEISRNGMKNCTN